MWCIGIMTIYVDIIINIFVTWKLEALYHGDHYYCQCQGSKKIKDKIWFLDPFGDLYFCQCLIIICFVISFCRNTPHNH